MSVVLFSFCPHFQLWEVKALEVAGPAVCAVQWEQGAGWQEWPLGYLAPAAQAPRQQANLELPGL